MLYKNILQSVKLLSYNLIYAYSEFGLPREEMAKWRSFTKKQSHQPEQNEESGSRSALRNLSGAGEAMRLLTNSPDRCPSWGECEIVVSSGFRAPEAREQISLAQSTVGAFKDTRFA